VPPAISIIIPAYNEKSRLASTVQNIARTRTSGARIEFVIVDDGSTDGTVENFISALPRLLSERDIDIRVETQGEHAGGCDARNHGAEIASADILFITEAQVEFSVGWDELILRRLTSDQVLAGTIAQTATPFRSYGCSLRLPQMTAIWNPQATVSSTPVPIAGSQATVVPRQLFHEIGGYDTGMVLGGAGAAEFSVRAWLCGAEVYSEPELEVTQQFKSDPRKAGLPESHQQQGIHSNLRFASLYLDEHTCSQSYEYYGRHFPQAFDAAQPMLEGREISQRRAWLEQGRLRSFEWFAGYFGIDSLVGREMVP